MQDEIKKNNDITASSEQAAKLKAMFPSCFDDEGRFRPDKLEEFLRADGADITREGYKLDWLGKSYARLLANLKTETLLAPNAVHNAKSENVNSQNLLIQGDNLDVLKHLVNAYSEKVKMIYIDPPYNTGSDGFVYSDDRKFSPKQLAELAGLEEDEAKRILAFTQAKSNSHSAWLTFMYPRLYVARELLKDDGVIFMSIDDSEQAQLKLLCDEVFGEENFVATVIWEKKYAPQNDAKWLSDNHDYILVYAKAKAIWRPNLLRRTAEQNDRYKNPDCDPRGVWKSADLSVRSYSMDYDYPIETPSGKSVNPPKGRCWFTNKTKMAELIADGRIWFGNGGDNVPSIKMFLSDVKDGVVPLTIWPYKEVGHNQDAAKEVRKLFDGENYFDTPKPVSLIKKATFVSGASADDIILDFFLGSGSTAHAVMALNAEDGGCRRYVGVQLDEILNEDAEARNAGYENIFEVARERIIRAASKVKSEHADATCDFGFKEFKTIPANDGPFAHYLDDANTMEDYIPFDGMTLDDDALNALLTTWKVYDGLPLHQELVPIDLGGYTAYLGEHILYFAHKGLELAHITEILRQINEDDDFAPRKLVVFHHVFGDKTLREFSEAVNAPNRMHLELTFEQRF